MCGLAGMMGPGITNSLREAYKELLYVSALRGREGTGVMGVNTRTQPQTTRTFKSIGEPNEFIYTHGDRGGFLSSSMYDVILGHCRWPTMGRTTLANVHPFDTGKFISAHNGTLESSKFRHKTKTDSEVMFRMMEEKGILPVLGGMRQWDAYAISMYSKHEKMVYLANNGKRPLAVAICKHHDALFWASEYLMLYAIMDRNHIPVEIFNLSPHQLYSIPIEGVKAGNNTPWSVDKIEIPKRTSEDDYYEAWLRGEISPRVSASTENKILNDAIPF